MTITAGALRDEPARIGTVIDGVLVDPMATAHETR